MSVLLFRFAPPLGVTLVLKRYSMIGDGLSHVGFGALAIAASLNLAPLQVAVPVIIIAAFLLLRLSEKSKLRVMPPLPLFQVQHLQSALFA